MTKVDKEKLLAALNDMQGGKDKGYFHDELEMLTALVLNASDDDIKTAWENISSD